MTETLDDGFDVPKTVSDAQHTFPGDVRELMPVWEEIPVIFRSFRGNEWTEFVDEWFFHGWPKRGLYSNGDIDPEKAYLHADTVMRSYQPKHEHKIAAVAWLLSRWFDRIGEGEYEH